VVTIKSLVVFVVLLLTTTLTTSGMVGTALPASIMERPMTIVGTDVLLGDVVMVGNDVIVGTGVIVGKKEIDGANVGETDTEGAADTVGAAEKVGDALSTSVGGGVTALNVTAVISSVMFATGEVAGVCTVLFPGMTLRFSELTTGAGV
jgi:hypothetical protein